jgi:hypothetical protein
MKKLIAIIILFLCVALFGAAYLYRVHACTNERSHLWTHHYIDSCELYYASDGVLSHVEMGRENVVLQDVSIATFDEIDTQYGRDAQRVFYEGYVVQDAHPESFMRVGGEYYSDKNSVFWRGELVRGAEADSFVLFGGSDAQFGRDANREYYAGSIIGDAASTTERAFLISPFGGEEVSPEGVLEVLWRPSLDPTVTKVKIALVDMLGTMSWLGDGAWLSGGTYMWDVTNADITQDMKYHLVFYALSPEGVYRIAPPAVFRVVENGRPDVVLRVENSSDEIVSVLPHEQVHISWASSNVAYCENGDEIEQPLVGHMFAVFPLDENAEVTEHVLTIYCQTDEGKWIKDSITVRTTAK